MFIQITRIIVFLYSLFLTSVIANEIMLISSGGNDDKMINYSTRTGFGTPVNFSVLELTIRFSGHEDPQFSKKGGSPSINVASPDFSCDESMNCSDQYQTSMPLICDDGYCQCRRPLCWIYSYEKHGFYTEFVYTCGICGQLGSECGASVSVSCDPPGYCASDGFCHCENGEHDGDICVVYHMHGLLQFLIAGLFIFLFLALGAILYQTFLSYRQNGSICWCRGFNARSRRRRRSRHQLRNGSTRSSDKSPAFTVQQRILQNFHNESDLSSEDERSETDDTPRDTKENCSLAEKSNSDHFSENCKERFQSTYGSSQVSNALSEENKEKIVYFEYSPTGDLADFRQMVRIPHEGDNHTTGTFVEMKNLAKSATKDNGCSVECSEVIDEDITGMTEYFHQNIYTAKI